VPPIPHPHRGNDRTTPRHVDELELPGPVRIRSDVLVDGDIQLAGQSLADRLAALEARIRALEP
jgi:hypothetical protein